MRDHLAANHWRGNLTYGLFASNESKSGSNNSFKRFTRNKNDLYRLDRPRSWPPHHHSILAALALVAVPVAVAVAVAVMTRTGLDRQPLNEVDLR